MFLTRNIKDYISNRHNYCMRDICYKCEPHKLESNNFSYTMYLKVHSALFTLSTFICIRGLVVSVDDSCFRGRGFEPQSNLLLCWFYFIFYWWIVFTELFKYILKLILNYFFKFERNMSWILLPQELPYYMFNQDGQQHRR